MTHLAEWLDLAMFLALCLLILLGFPVAFTLAGTSLLFAGIGYAMGVFDSSFFGLFSEPHLWRDEERGADRGAAVRGSWASCWNAPRSLRSCWTPWASCSGPCAAALAFQSPWSEPCSPHPPASWALLWSPWGSCHSPPCSGAVTIRNSPVARSQPRARSVRSSRLDRARGARRSDLERSPGGAAGAWQLGAGAGFGR